jgi:hypothetical protein
MDGASQALTQDKIEQTANLVNVLIELLLI